MSVDNLVLLVGSSPLPNYLAVQMLLPHAVWLIYTPETSPVKDRLKNALLGNKLVTEVKDLFLEDAGDAKKARQTVSSLPPGCHLHYTGGTKAMGVHVYEAWRDKFDGKPTQASYLDDRAESLRIDDGSQLPMRDFQFNLDLQTMADLEGLQKLTVRSNKPPIPHQPTPDDALAIAHESLTNRPDLPSQLYDRVSPDGKLKSYDEVRTDPIRPPEEFGLVLSVPEVPGNGWSNAQIKLWLDFLKGDWLEDWTGQCVESLGLGSVYVGNRAVRHNSRSFETDVALIRGHRLYLISCTTDSTPSTCKYKLFEVGHRARHLGGDLARFALVCLLDEQRLSADKLEQDVEDDWGAGTTDGSSPNPVFAPRHLREWLNGDTDSLKRWLEQ